MVQESNPRQITEPVQDTSSELKPGFRGDMTAEQLKAEAGRPYEGRPIDVRGYSFQDQDLRGIPLRGADMSMTNLRGCLFHESDLHGANLFRADCSPSRHRSTSFSNANLSGANLNRAVLNNADLSGTDASGADLRKAILVSVDLSYSQLVNANFEDADLTEASLLACDLTRAILHRASLGRVNFKQAIFENTRLESSSLGDAILQEQQGLYQDAKPVYLALKKNFQEIGDYGASSWAYIKERNMQRMSYWPPTARLLYYDKEVPLNPIKGMKQSVRTAKFDLKYLWLWLTSSASWLFFGYGEIPWHVAIFAVACIAFFSVAFHMCGGFETRAGSLPKSGDYILHAFSAFAGAQYLDPVSSLAQIVTVATTVTGVIALAAFTTAMTQRIGRS